MPLAFRRNILARGKEWKAGEKPEEKSVGSTLTYFKGDYFLKKDKACGEFGVLNS